MRAWSRKGPPQLKSCSAPIITKSAGIATDNDNALLWTILRYGAGNLLQQFSTSYHRLCRGYKKRRTRWQRLLTNRYQCFI